MVQARYYLNHRDGDGFTDVIKNSFDAKAKAAGMQVEFKDAKGDCALQEDQLNEAIAAKPSAIVAAGSRWCCYRSNSGESECSWYSCVYHEPYGGRWYRHLVDVG